MPKATQLLSNAWALYKQHFVLFGKIYILPIIAMPFLGLLLLPAEGTPQFYFIGALVIIATILINAAAFIALTKAVSEPTIATFKTAYQAAFPLILSYLWVSILVGATVFLGLLLLIVPAIIFGIWFSMTQFMVIFEGKRGVNAMQASRELVKGHFFEILKKLLFLFVVMVVISFIIYAPLTLILGGQENVTYIVIDALVTFVIAQISIIYIYQIYQSLKSLSGEYATTTQNDTVAQQQPLQTDSM